MMDRGVSSRYATALFNSALQQNIIDDVHEQMMTIKKVVETNKRFFNFLVSPQVRTEDKHDILDSTLKGNASDLFVRFLHLLVDKKRILLVKEIADEFHELYEDHKGVLMVRVTTAIPLDEAMERQVIDRLRAETGKDVRIDTAVDPGIVGGVILQFKDKIIDGSVRFRLEKLRRELDAIRV